jgi:hypothetical protein
MAELKLQRPFEQVIMEIIVNEEFKFNFFCNLVSRLVILNITKWPHDQSFFSENALITLLTTSML